MSRGESGVGFSRCVGGGMLSGRSDGIVKRRGVNTYLVGDGVVRELVISSDNHAAAQGEGAPRDTPNFGSRELLIPPVGGGPRGAKNVCREDLPEIHIVAPPVPVEQSNLTSDDLVSPPKVVVMTKTPNRRPLKRYESVSESRHYPMDKVESVRLVLEQAGPCSDSCPPPPMKNLGVPPVPPPSKTQSKSPLTQRELDRLLDHKQPARRLAFTHENPPAIDVADEGGSSFEGGSSCPTNGGGGVSKILTEAEDDDGTTANPLTGGYPPPAPYPPVGSSTSSCGSLSPRVAKSQRARAAKVRLQKYHEYRTSVKSFSRPSPWNAISCDSIKEEEEAEVADEDDNYWSDGSFGSIPSWGCPDFLGGPARSSSAGSAGAPPTTTDLQDVVEEGGGRALSGADVAGSNGAATLPAGLDPMRASVASSSIESLGHFVASVRAELDASSRGGEGDGRSGGVVSNDAADDDSPRPANRFRGRGRPVPRGSNQSPSVGRSRLISDSVGKMFPQGAGQPTSIVPPTHPSHPGGGGGTPPDHVGASSGAVASSGAGSAGGGFFISKDVERKKAYVSGSSPRPLGSSPGGSAPGSRPGSLPGSRRPTPRTPLPRPPIIAPGKHSEDTDSVILGEDD